MAATKKKPTRKKASSKKATSKKNKKKVVTKPIIVQRFRLNSLNNRLNKPLKRQLKTPRARRLVKLLQSQKFGKFYIVSSLLILLVTTTLWALLSSKLHQSNTDQLVNAYLFQDLATLRGASFPDQHTFLFKWPLFYLISLLGYMSSTFAFVTIEITLATVGLLAIILYRIESRPLVYGTLCLALASVLLLIPTQPYAGALLPVNIAMITTRNLEYVLYVAGLWLLIRAGSFRNWRFIGGVGLLGLLIASDKLFMGLSIGGALLAIGFYSLMRRWQIVSLSLKWLAGSILATLAGFGIIAIIVASNITNIDGAGAGPYGFVDSTKGIALGVIYAISGLATNLGANPAYDAVQLSQIPTKLAERLWSVSGLSFLVNIAIFAYGLRACYGIIKNSLTYTKTKTTNSISYSHQLSLTLVFTSLAAIGVFVATKHYYAVDARYLSISLFAIFVAIASAGIKKKWNPIGLLALGTALLASIILGSISASLTYRDSNRALTETDRRNAVVAQAIKNHKVSTLLGDYWRVLPIKSKSGGYLPVSPLQDCTTPRGVLSSSAWQKNLNGQSFAYLLSFDKGLTDFPQCTLDQVIKKYGLPNISTLIAGTLSDPKEVLLFYDDGTQKNNSSTSNDRYLSTILPIALNQLPGTTCGQTNIMNIVAHQDDDLLFMNPDLLHSLAAGDCVRTVYITAGDSGNNYKYWQSREQGSQAAYSSMLGKNYTWEHKIVKLGNNRFITVANPKGNPRVSLIFMRLPDGNLRGEGFGPSSHKSLSQLAGNNINKMSAVDEQSSYTSDELIKTLSSLARTYQPTEIRTQSDYDGSEFPDHSDHRAVSFYAKQVHSRYQKEQRKNSASVPIKFYIGYPIHSLEDNISPEDLVAKETAFLAYSKFDDSVCSSSEDCRYTSTYGSYLPRQYLSPY